MNRGPKLVYGEQLRWHAAALRLKPPLFVSMTWGRLPRRCAWPRHFGEITHSKRGIDVWLNQPPSPQPLSRPEEMNWLELHLSQRKINLKRRWLWPKKYDILYYRQTKSDHNSSISPHTLASHRLFNRLTQKKLKHIVNHSEIRRTWKISDHPNISLLRSSIAWRRLSTKASKNRTYTTHNFKDYKKSRQGNQARFDLSSKTPNQTWAKPSTLDYLLLCINLTGVIEGLGNGTTTSIKEQIERKTDIPSPHSNMIIPEICDLKIYQ
jgi:hypothetical protein